MAHLIAPSLPQSLEGSRACSPPTQPLNMAFENVHTEGVCSSCLVLTSEKYNNIIYNCMRSTKHFMCIISCDHPARGVEALVLLIFR